MYARAFQRRRNKFDERALAYLASAAQPQILVDRNREELLILIGANRIYDTYQSGSRAIPFHACLQLSDSCR
jgi:hypothetical protein